MYKRIKKILDISISFCLLLILSPFMILFSILIFIFLGKPVFYTQERTGLHNRSFVIYKYRSMHPASGKYKTEAQRIPRFGKILRQFRIDELPQLLNIVKGDMSFIGPRPLLPDYLEYYNDFEIRRHDVRPGLSGYSQIKNLHSIEWEEQFSMDVYYVENISFKLDLYILIKTLQKIFQPSKMTTTRITGRPRFDVYRKKQING